MVVSWGIVALLTSDSLLWMFMYSTYGQVPELHTVGHDAHSVRSVVNNNNV